MPCLPPRSVLALLCHAWWSLVVMLIVIDVRNVVRPAVASPRHAYHSSRRHSHRAYPSAHVATTCLVQCVQAPQDDACTRVEDIWGIGPGYSKRLKTHDIRTALQLRDANDRWVRQQLGVVGLRIVWELRGISCLPLELCPPPKKSLMVSRSFGKIITALTEMREAVATYYDAGG